jgi:predicted GNAT family acetyltransferase
VRVGDLLSLLQYRVAGAKMIIFHTEVPPAVQNRGLAERLTKAAFEFARAEKLTVEPRCPYIRCVSPSAPRILRSAVAPNSFSQR